MKRLRKEWWPVGWVALLTCATFGFGPTVGAAEPVEGVVVHVDDQEVVVDLGLEDGLPADGASLTVYRRLVVHHPISNEEIQDRFPIGEVRPERVGKRLSIIGEVKGLSRAPKVGDFVVYTPPRPKSRAQSGPDRTRRPDADVPQDAALDTLLTDLWGRSLRERIERMDAFLRTNPQAPYADRLREEIRTLQTVAEHGQSDAETLAQLTYRFDAGRHLHVVENQPVETAIAIRPDERVRGAVLYTRPKGARGFVRTDLARIGDTQWSGRMPTEATAIVGESEYFIEAVRLDGTLQPLVGSDEAPAVVHVLEAPDRRRDFRNRTQLVVYGEYVDFGLVGVGQDHYFQAEVAAQYALTLTDDVPTLAFRRVQAGVGTIDGIGQRTSALERGVAGKRISLAYGFAELELEITEFFGFAARVMGGNHHDTPRAASKNVGGIELRTRVGHWDDTRLQLGTALIQDLGQRYFMTMMIHTFDRIPVEAGVSVTSLPVNANLGVRLTGGAGYEVADWFGLRANIGWNARTINHYGVSGGGGLEFHW